MKMKLKQRESKQPVLERTEWFDTVIERNPLVVRHSPFVAELPVPSASLHEVQTCAYEYIAACCNLAGIEFDRSYGDIGQGLETIIDEIPNITPNGILLPKAEVNHEFNRLQLAARNWFQDLGMADRIDSVFTPLTLRLSRGKPKGEFTARPYATTKIHIDSWAGDPADSVAIHLPVFGDVANTTVGFFESVTEPTLQQLRWINDFEQGLKALGEIRPLPAKPRIGKAVLFDNSVPHQTVKKGGMTRVSLEFRVRRRISPSLKRAVEALCDAKRCKNYRPYEEWLKIGESQFLYFSDTMENAKKGLFSANPYSLDLYAIKSGPPHSFVSARSSEKIESITLQDFAQHHQAKLDDLPEICRDQLNALNTRHSVVSSEEKEIHLKKTQALIDQKTPRDPEENQRCFEAGWGEILAQCKSGKISRQSLRPQYVKPFDVIRYNGTLIRPENGYFFQALQEISLDYLFTKYLADYDHIYEFGCGTGRNLFRLAELYPGKTLHGFDWTPSTLELLNLMNANGKDIHGGLLNMLDPSGNEEVIAGSALITVDSMEQLGTNFGPFFDFLISKTPGVVMHYEPIVENYATSCPLDQMARKYHRKRGYLEGYLPHLQKREKEGKIQIIASFRTGYGDPWNEGTSVIIWQPA